MVKFVGEYKIGDDDLVIPNVGGFIFKPVNGCFCCEFIDCIGE
jgi:hypothetical protein